MQVEPNIPIPKRYPFAQMKPGDSFVIPNEIARNTVSVAAMRYGRAHGCRFTTRTMPDGTIRCWRIE